MTPKRTKPDNALGQQLKARRRALGWSQREASAIIGGISFPYLCQLETGKTKSPTISIGLAIAKAYSLPIEQIAAWTEQPHEDRMVCDHCGQEIEP